MSSRIQSSTASSMTKPVAQIKKIKVAPGSHIKDMAALLSTQAKAVSAARLLAVASTQGPKKDEDDDENLFGDAEVEPLLAAMKADESMLNEPAPTPVPESKPKRNTRMSARAPQAIEVRHGKDTKVNIIDGRTASQVEAAAKVMRRPQKAKNSKPLFNSKRPAFKPKPRMRKNANGDLVFRKVSSAATRGWMRKREDVLE
jgi:hypothetical protein